MKAENKRDQKLHQLRVSIPTDLLKRPNFWTSTFTATYKQLSLNRTLWHPCRKQLKLCLKVMHDQGVASSNNRWLQLSFIYSATVTYHPCFDNVESPCCTSKNNPKNNLQHQRAYNENHSTPHTHYNLLSWPTGVIWSRLDPTRSDLF